MLAGAVMIWSVSSCAVLVGVGFIAFGSMIVDGCSRQLRFIRMVSDVCIDVQCVKPCFIAG